MEFRYQQGDNGRMVLEPNIREQLLEISSWSRYFAYHDMCRQLYRQSHPDAATRPLPDISRAGFQRFSALVSPEQVASLVQLLDDGVAGPDLDEAGKPMWLGSLRWTMARIHVVRQTLATIFGGPLGAALEGYFGSYFRVMSVSLVRGYPGQASGSFLWHRDYQPPQQTHLMVYLTDSSEEGGGTTFLDLEDTKAAALSGFHFHGTDESRVDTIEKLEAKVGKRLTTHRFDLKAGDGVLFAAPRILHQGNRPKTGWRDTLMVLVLPSPVPWEAFIAKDTAKYFITRHPGAATIEPFEDTSLPRENFSCPDWAALGEMFPPGYAG